MKKSDQGVSPKREDEAARLAALDSYGILDTPAEQGFDDIVMLASQICRTPVALVSLVANDRQWFKARIGFDACETPLSQSVCAHTLWRPGLLVINDLTADPRTRDNTLVTAPPHIRFYAGARLETPSGKSLGALCVIDTQPRPDGLTTAQANSLEALARQVMVQLELRRSMINLETRIAEKAQERSRIWQVSPDLIGVLNTDAVFESSNPAWQQLLGWSEAEVASRPFFDFLHPDDLPANHAAWREALSGHPILNFENRYRCADGTYRWLLWVAVREGDKVYCTARDITARKQLQESNAAFAVSLAAEQTASALREQFIAVLGHDLRNPVAAIDGGMSILLRTPLPEQATTIATMAQSSARRMATLIENLMDFARGRLGDGFTLQREADVPLEPLLNHVIAELRSSHPTRRVDVDFDLQEPVDCDRSRVGQLFSNLLGNAMTHGAPDAPVTVNAIARAGKFELSVSNGGEPIPTAALENLFQPFFRAKVRPSQEGLGLGLYIASEISRAHGGELSVASDPMETRFTFRMPL
jgi:sigma-B regulation protein RsbU (phosphoserine phosphatase)